MKKRTILLISIIYFTIGAIGQTLRPTTMAQQKNIIGQITNAESSIRTLQCNFTQTKHLSMLNDKMISKGKMVYQSPASLHWEYQTPYQYLFIINGAKVLIKQGGKRNAIDVKSNRMFKEITRVMMNSVTGHNLSSSSDFSVKIFTSADAYIANLTPKNKQMKSMFSSIRLHFNAKRCIVSRIEMFEKSGDSTDIELHDVQINSRINEKEFDLD